MSSTPASLYHHYHKYKATIITTILTIQPIPLPPPSLPSSKNIIVALIQQLDLPAIQQLSPPPSTILKSLVCGGLVVSRLLVLVLDTMVGMVVVGVVGYFTVLIMVVVVTVFVRVTI